MTNGDMIRQMTDKELVKITYEAVRFVGPWCTPGNEPCKHAHEKYTCEQCMMDWLKEDIRTEKERAYNEGWKQGFDFAKGT